MIGARLKLARTAVGLSLRELSEKIGNQVTAQAIGKYERDEMMPGSSVLIALARALGVSESYLLSSGELELDQVEFRKTGKKEREEAQLRSQVLGAAERYLEIEDLLGLGSVAWATPQGFPYPLNEIAEAETAALRLRSTWGL